MTVRIERTVTSGVFSLDGEDFDVDNNVWLVGDETDVVVIDAAHDAAAVVAAAGERRLRAIICTHGHNDHINAAVEVADRTRAPILLHPDDRVLWDMTHPHRLPDGALVDGQRLELGEVVLEVVHTPGHSPGGVCLYLPAEDTLFSGDTLFNGGPGATGRSYSDRSTLVESIRRRLFVLPPATRVRTGHGEDTTIRAEAAALG